MDDNDKKFTGKFKISGFPTNDEIDVPDEQDDTPKKNKNIPTLRLDISDLDKDISSILESNGISQEDFMKELQEYAKDPTRLFNDLNEALQGTAAEDPSEDNTIPIDGGDDEDDDDAIPFKLGSIIVLLNPDTVWSIKCKEDPELYHKFTEKYGDNNITCETFPASMKMTDYTQCFPAAKIGKITIIDYSDKYVLMSCESKDPNEVNVYLAAYETPEGDIELYVPTYGNTFKIEDGDLFSSKNPMDKSLFNEKGQFLLTDIDKIETGLDMTLVPEKKPLITPNKFGTFKKMISAIPKNGSSAIRVGILQSNESTDAKMFKRDFDFPAEKTKFDFYLNFNEQLTHDELAALSEALLSHLDFEKTLLFDECELKVKGDSLYINVDIGKLPENIQHWWNDEGNAF